VFTPLTALLIYGEPVVRRLGSVARAVPSWLVPFYVDILLDVLRQDPRPSASVIQGLLFGRVAPHRDERRKFRAPALVIGHPRDPIHPFSDADALAAELPHGRLVQARSMVELRLWPGRITGEIAAFLDECTALKRAS